MVVTPPAEDPITHRRCSGLSSVLGLCTLIIDDVIFVCRSVFTCLHVCLTLPRAGVAGSRYVFQLTLAEMRNNLTRSLWSPRIAVSSAASKSQVHLASSRSPKTVRECAGKRCCVDVSNALSGALIYSSALLFGHPSSVVLSPVDAIGSYFTQLVDCRTLQYLIPEGPSRGHSPQHERTKDTPQADAE